MIELENGQYALYPNNRMRIYDNSLTPVEPKMPDFKVSTQYYQVENGFERLGMGREDEYFWKTSKELKRKKKSKICTNHKRVVLLTTIIRKMATEHDFLDNLGNHQHQKMLREISNDDLTPKKRILLMKMNFLKMRAIQNHFYE